MTLDLAVLGLVALFAVWGLFTGAARQLARWAGAAAAFAAAGPAGRILSVPVAQRLGTSLTLGTVIGTLGAFLFIYILVQLVLTALLKRAFDGGGSRRGFDRFLGFGLGGLQAASICYLSLCAGAFLENNVTIAGRTLAFTPKDSQLMKVVRAYNVLELQQFSGAHDLVKAAKVANDPKLSEGLKEQPDLAVLKRDPRFRSAMNSEAVRKALETGDIRPLLSSNEFVELIHDPAMLERIEHVAARFQEPIKP